MSLWTRENKSAAVSVFKNLCNAWRKKKFAHTQNPINSTLNTHLNPYISKSLILIIHFYIKIDILRCIQLKNFILGIFRK